MKMNFKAMNKTFWTIWDAASYDIVNTMLNEGSLPNLKKILKTGKGFPVILNDYNSQTPCALAMQFTGKDSSFLDVGGYNTPNYKSLEHQTGYYCTFRNKKVSDYLAWHQKYIGYKKIGLSQVPYSSDETNEIYGIDGFSKKKADFKLIYETDFVKTKKTHIKTMTVTICNQTYTLFLIRENQYTYLRITTANNPNILTIECDINQNNDIWISNCAGFKIFVFTKENKELFILITDTWEYSLKNLRIDKFFHSEVGVFIGRAYGRLYRSGEFGRPFYEGGNGRAEEIYLDLLKTVSNSFTSLNMWLINACSFSVIISYQPCIDEASHEFYGWWKNTEGRDKEYFWNLLKQAYTYADNHLGCILDKMDLRDNIIVTSDHGIYSVSYDFFLNDYLKQKKMLFCNGGKIDTNKSYVYYHPAETGAVYFNKNCTEKEIKDIKDKLLALVFDGKKIIKQLLKTNSKVMGDYYLIPEDEINIRAGFDAHIICKTQKSGCHTVYNYKSSMRAICFVCGKNICSLPESGKEISYKVIRNILIAFVLDFSI